MLLLRAQGGARWKQLAVCRGFRSLTSDAPGGATPATNAGGDAAAADGSAGLEAELGKVAQEQLAQTGQQQPRSSR